VLVLVLVLVVVLALVLVLGRARVLANTVVASPWHIRHSKLAGKETSLTKLLHVDSLSA